MLSPRISKDKITKRNLNILLSRNVVELADLFFGIVLSYVKYYYYKLIFHSFGKHCFISHGVITNYVGNISIGNSVMIGRYVTLIGNSEKYKPSIIIGDNVDIFPFVVIDTQDGFINIGNGSSIGLFCVLHGIGGIEIGNNVSIAAKTTIVGGNHGFNGKQPTSKGVKIGDDVWIGTNVSILDGVEIGKGSIIGAGAVVTKSIPEYSVAVGVPAKVANK